MRRPLAGGVLVLVFVCAAAGCAVRPSSRGPEPGTPAEWRAASVAADSLRPLDDSFPDDSFPMDGDLLPVVPGTRPAADAPDTAQATQGFRFRVRLFEPRAP